MELSLLESWSHQIDWGKQIMKRKSPMLARFEQNRSWQYLLPDRIPGRGRIKTA
jgi:hypothetical protein